MSGDEIGSLPVMNISDMRARQDFEVGDRVICPGGECGTGVIVMIDPDYRLARVMWSKGKIGWWYLKDLVIVVGKSRSIYHEPVGIIKPREAAYLIDLS